MTLFVLPGDSQRADIRAALTAALTDVLRPPYGPFPNADSLLGALSGIGARVVFVPDDEDLEHGDRLVVLAERYWPQGGTHLVEQPIYGVERKKATDP